MRALLRLIVLAASLIAPSLLHAQADPAFPAVEPARVGLDAADLDRLAALVDGFVEQGKVVGAELLVIKDRKTVHHSAHGFIDREAKKAMHKDAVFCVRSMTKPFIGAAIMMLVQDGLVALDDPVSKHLPEFGKEATAGIEIEHLLRHTSGLPMSLLIGHNLKEFSGVREVAKLGAGRPLDSVPGSKVTYSDQGTDTLTAVIEVVSGMPAEAFIRQRLLDPLGMSSSACLLPLDHPLRKRAGSKYLGAAGSWTRYWKPEDPALFSVFLGSQSLYSTTKDYARFLDFWLRKGRGPDKRLLARRHVRTIMRPGELEFPGASGFLGARADYGGLMQLWTVPAGIGSDRKVVAFGHSGSDGTYAWAFPEQRAMVLYFTQSRMTPTGSELEELLGQIFLGEHGQAPIPLPPLAPFLGYYREHEDDQYRAIIRHEEGLALEILGRAVVPLKYLGEDRWSLRPRPRVVLEFDRSKSGAITGYRIGDHQEFRFEPSAGLPSGAKINDRVRRAHRLDLLEQAGPLRLSGDLAMERQGLEGTWSTTIGWPDRFHMESSANGVSERVGILGSKVWYATSEQEPSPMEGDLAEFARRDTLLARCGDWTRWFPSARVIQSIPRNGREVIVVRFGDTSSPAVTLFIDAETGRVVRQLSMANIAALGTVGQQITFEDFRTVEGMVLPFRTELTYATPLLGKLVLTTTKHSLPGPQPDALFRLAK